MSVGGGGYASGRNALAICERCAKKIPYRNLKQDGQYPDLKVCSDCWDPKHPQEYLADTFDPVTLWDPTGDPERTIANRQSVSFPQFLNTPPYPEDTGDQYSPGVLPNLNFPQSSLQMTILLNQTKYNLVTGDGITES